MNQSAAAAPDLVSGHMPTHTMKTLDRILQRWRINAIRRYVPRGGRVLDIGCADGALFRVLQKRIGSGVGIDPELAQNVESRRFRLIAGPIPNDLSPANFDSVTMLAVVEHLPESVIAEMRESCVRLLKPGGVVLITVPSPLVDTILRLLIKLKLVGWMSFEQHHGFDTKTVVPSFTGTGLELVKHKKFQLGLNNLFVFRRSVTNPAPFV